MTAPNGGANGRADAHSNGTGGRALGIAPLETQNAQRFSAQQVKELVAELEIPFEPSVIEWRVTNTAQGQSRGQVVPYADPRAYTDRLNTIFSPAGWTRKYAVQRRMYRGLLKHIARVWNPRDIQDVALLQQVLAHMQAAERGFHRLDAAVGNVGREALTRILRSLNLQSLDLVDNLQTLREIVLALEASAPEETNQ